MQEVDKVVRKVLKLDETTESKEATCTIFEDYSPSRIYNVWRFNAPLAEKNRVDVDLHRLLKHVNLGGGKSLLGQFSSEVNRYRLRCHGPRAPTEDDLLCYLNFVAVLNLLFENNTTPYAYVLASTGKVIHSDKFLFEYLQTLVTLLAYYDNLISYAEGISQEAAQTQTRYCQLCAAILTEILARCREVQPPSKLLYVEPPRSIGMDPRTGNVVVVTSATVTAGGEERPSPPLSMREYIQCLLGGEAAVEARLHLCVAKENEVMFRATGECVYMTAAHRAYKQASVRIVGSGCDAGLANHCRFMAHYWFCRAHFFLAKRDATVGEGLLKVLRERAESEEQLEQARLVLARLLLITREAKEMEKNEAVLLDNLSGELEDSYNELIQELTALTTEFDTEFYVKRKIKEKEGVKLTLPVLRQAERNVALLADACQEARKRYMEQHPAIAEAQQLLRSLHEKLKNGEGLDGLLPVMGNSNSSINIGGDEIGTMDYSIRMGHLREREAWLEYLLSAYSMSDHTFAINSDHHALFERELKSVREAYSQLLIK